MKFVALGFLVCLAAGYVHADPAPVDFTTAGSPKSCGDPSVNGFNLRKTKDECTGDGETWKNTVTACLDCILGGGFPELKEKPNAVSAAEINKYDEGRRKLFIDTLTATIEGFRSNGLMEGNTGVMVDNLKKTLDAAVLSSVVKEQMLTPLTDIYKAVTAAQDPSYWVCCGALDGERDGGCVAVNHVNDNPGSLTCDCVQPDDDCLVDGGCVYEPQCSGQVDSGHDQGYDQGSGSGWSEPSMSEASMRACIEGTLCKDEFDACNANTQCKSEYAAAWTQDNEPTGGKAFQKLKECAQSQRDFQKCVLVAAGDDFDLRAEVKKILVAGGATNSQVEKIFSGLDNMGDQLKELVRPGGKGNPDMSKLFENELVKQAVKGAGVDLEKVQAKADEYVFDDGEDDGEDDAAFAVSAAAVAVAAGIVVALY